MSVSKYIKVLLLAVVVTGLIVAFGCDNPAAMNKSTANVRHVTDADFTNEVLRASQPVVVDFYATWCEPCKEQGPMLDRLAGHYAGHLKFVKVNVDESPVTSEKCRIDPIPTVVFFTNGIIAGSIVGLADETDLRTNLDALVATK